MSGPIATYTGADVAIRYDRTRCIHAAECGRSHGDVFTPGAKPWANPDAAPADEVVAVVARCPTGALTTRRLDGGAEEAAADRNTVTVSARGPLYLRGRIRVRHADGREDPLQARVALCRCGASKIKPYCDGSHTEAGFTDAGPVASDPEDVALDAGELVVTVPPRGPLLLSGPFTLRSGAGRDAFKGTKAALCRCGGSANRPLCDGTHSKIGFDGT